MDVRRPLLRRNKAIATGLLLAATLLFIVARLQHDQGIWGWIAAFSEAAMVGALADWFAVVALFRHPLGLPIPHTAIIKQKQSAIAGNLAGFIRDKFLASDTLLERLRAYDPARHLAGYLSSGEHAAGLSRGACRLLAESLDFLDDERVQQLVRAALHNRLEQFDLSASLESLLEALRRDNRHQRVLDELLQRLATWLESEEARNRLAGSIDNLCTKEYPLLSVFIPNREQFARGAGDKVADRLNAFLQEVQADPAHELRHKFDGAVSQFVARLRSDSVLRGKVEALKQELLQNQVLSDYAGALVADLKNWLQEDLQRTDSQLQARLASLIAGLGTALELNRGLQESLNEHLERLLLQYAEPLRNAVSGHITATMQQWDSEAYTGEIELSIGSDLQFIRMNGTLVGGLIGVLLHALSLMLA